MNKKKKSWILDAYRANGKIILWLKTENKNERVEKDISISIYAEMFAEKLLNKHKITYKKVSKKNYLDKWVPVLEIPVKLNEYECLVKFIEKSSKHRITLYNADISPEQQYLLKHNLYSGYPLNSNDFCPSLVSGTIKLELNKIITSISVNEKTFEGEEKDILNDFLIFFNKIDPDILLMDYAFSNLPLLVQKLQEYGFEIPFHRWDKKEIKHRGGKSFFSYGSVSYKDYAIRLNGRFLIDTASTIGSECEIDGIFELCKLSGARFQQIASRSFGAVFQHALTKVMFQKNILIPYKEKPVDIPLTMFDLLKADRGGHTFDAKVGFHKDVAEIDFCSMFPWLIYNKNISADTILAGKPPYEEVPDLPIKVSHNKKGLIPLAIKPIIDARMYYKKNPSAINQSRAKALKMVLVTAYGYLRFREFKLGIASSHMAICAYSREIIIQSARLAEQYGFEVIHGIVDSLYIKKKGLTKKNVEYFVHELEKLVQIPVSINLFRWVVFLPSVNDSKRPLPATYYGIFQNGDIKARGIEVRQKRTPTLVKIFQQQILDKFSSYYSKKEIIQNVPLFCRQLKVFLQQKFPHNYYAYTVRISKVNYVHNIAQKKIVYKLKKQGVKILPGMKIQYIMQNNYSPVLPQDYNGKPDQVYYQKLLVRSLFIILQPFGITQSKILSLVGVEKQLLITDFSKDKLINYKYIPYHYDYKTNKGLAERQLKKKLENQGWMVWRGSCINLLRKKPLYPNVYKKYQLLINFLSKHHPLHVEYLEYLCAIHHGMPDFICFRNNKFKFVECKFNHEPLSKRQEKCFQKLKLLNFEVEVLKFIHPAIRIREKQHNLVLNKTVILSKQLTLKT